MSDEVDLPRWVIRRYVVVKDKKVDRFETLPEATLHRQKHGGEVRELVFRLSEIKTHLSLESTGRQKQVADFFGDFLDIVY